MTLIPALLPIGYGTPTIARPGIGGEPTDAKARQGADWFNLAKPEFFDLGICRIVFRGHHHVLTSG
jgi:hypothetical protein